MSTCHGAGVRGQRPTLWSWFSSATFMSVPGVKLRTSGFVAVLPSEPIHQPLPYCFFRLGQLILPSALMICTVFKYLMHRRWCFMMLEFILI